MKLCSYFQFVYLFFFFSNGLEAVSFVFLIESYMERLNIKYSEEHVENVAVRVFFFLPGIDFY